MGSDLQAALNQSKVQETRTGGVQHMKFGSVTDGGWVCGANADDISEAEMLINTQSLRHGWHLWCDGALTETMVSFVAGLPAEPEPVKDKNKKIQQATEAREIQGMIFDEDGEGFPAQYAASSFGARAAVDGLFNAIRARAATEAEFLYPLVKLTNTGEPYENKYKAGEMIHNPAFEILAWCNMNGDEQGEAAEKIAAPAEEPVAEEAVKEETAEPVRKRRRKA
jgi:hypothetical protein